MKALKVMFNDGTIAAYRVVAPIAAAQMIEMTEEEFGTYDSTLKPGIGALFQDPRPGTP